MCGIVGLIDFHSAVDAEEIRRAAATLHRRGPDESGVWISKNLGLGHQRLAILDLTPTGHQPMTSSDERFVIVFNGEIYNFLELRDQLNETGVQWRSRSDTEVILAAYAKWGRDCVTRFHGMFAFAIWDQREKVLFAARDRMGVKPFYYSESHDGFAFASRPRALLALQPNLSRDLDEQALRLYLESGYVPAPYSIFRAIRKLPPAHWLLFRDGCLQVERYWDFRRITPESTWEKRREEDLLDELDELLSRSVKSRMISDVPLGAFLSGGIDSSAVVAVMAKYSSRPVKTFTIGFEEKQYDESPHALAVARHLGTDHHCEELKLDDLLCLLPNFCEEFDEPFFDYSAFPTMAVSRMARRQVTVSLSGDGGDELFGGYHYYKILWRLGPLYRFPNKLRRWLATVASLVPRHRLQLLSATLRQTSDVAAFCFARSIAKDFDGALVPEVLCRTQSLLDLFAKAAECFPPGLDASEKAMRLDAFYTLPDDYLQKVDVASMAFSLESREPLLDQDLIEWAMRLPLRWKLRAGQSKYLLRRLAYRYVPRRILDRPKRGFGVPLADWLRGPLKSWAADRITDKRALEKIPIRQRAVLELFDLHQSKKRDAHPLLWAILILLEFVSRPVPVGVFPVPLPTAKICSTVTTNRGS